MLLNISIELVIFTHINFLWLLESFIIFNIFDYIIIIFCLFRFSSLDGNVVKVRVIKLLFSYFSFSFSFCFSFKPN